MPLLIASTEIEDNDNNSIIVDGGRRRLYVRGSGFISCGFDLEVVVLNDKKTDIDDKYIKVSDIGDEISENELSVSIEAISDEHGNIVVGHRDIVVKKKKNLVWKPEICGKDDGIGNADCAQLARAIDIVK
jgi:hypothetical protein